ncbi:BC1881 family protein [Paenibacillus polymyxa]|nr:BC1881 family protein [Paenibacillus polymyxa]
MKLHKDGTLEGTPEELLEYERLFEKEYPKMYKLAKFPYSYGEVQQVSNPFISSEPSKGVFQDKSFNFRDLTREEKEVILMEYSTKQLLKELEARTGVHKYNVSPEGEVKIIEGEVGCIIKGPAIVLEIKQ